MNQEEFEEAFNRLTPRRKQVLRRVLAGETDGAIAKSLEIGEATVRKHIERICQTLGLDNDHADERRYKRLEVAKLVAKYKPELLTNSTPVTANQVTPETANAKDTSDAEIGAAQTPEPTKLAEHPQDEPDVIWQLPAMTQSVREQLLKTFSQLIDEEPKRKQIAKNLNKIGYEHYLEGDFQRAAFYLQWAIEFNPNLGGAHYNLGSTYEKLEDSEGAYHHYQTAANHKGRAADAALSNLARLDILAGNSATAIERLLPKINQVKDASVKSSVHKNLGWAYLLQKHYSDAQYHLQKAIELDSERAASYCLLAQVQDIQGDEESALVSWANCLTYDTRDKRRKEVAWRSPELDFWQFQARERLKPSGNYADISTTSE